MKPSRFNYTTAIDDGQTLFFNFYTLNLLVLEPKEASFAKSILKDPQSSAWSADNEIAKLLVEKGFLVDSRIDEIALCQTLNERARTATGRLSLTIAPTLRCNFSCKYCYQTGTGPVMNDEAASALLGFVEQKLISNGYLSITWFGGEPLLEFNRIESLDAGLLRIADKKNARYSASLVTNGYLLEKATVAKLVKHRVKSVQITLDGPPHIHNQRRKVKGGGPSFERIMQNIKNASDKLAVSVRMNIDHENKDYITDFLEILDRENLNKRVGLYLGHVLPYTAICQDVASSCVSAREFSILGMKTLLELSRRSFSSVFNYPKSMDCHCMADNQNAFVVTPTGGLAKCWNDVGQPESEIGHLLKPTTYEMEKNRQRWLERDPFNLACRDCLLLPICMGGCPYNYLKNGELDCHRWKYHIQENLMVYYYFKQIDREGRIADNFIELCKTLKKLGGLRWEA